MRYTLESTLPLGAFEHCGNGKIRLHGGGGGGFIEDIGSAVSDAVSGVGDFVSGAVEGVSDALSQIDPGPAIGDVGASVDNAVNDVVPGGWGTVAAATAAALTMQPEILAAALPEEAAALTTEEILASQFGDAAFQLSPEFSALAPEAASSLDAIDGSSFLPSDVAEYAGDNAYELQGIQEGYESAANPLGDVTNPDGSITSTFDDGSTITRSATGEILETTPAIDDPFQWSDALKAANMARQAYGVAKTAYGLLNPASTARSALSTKLANISPLTGSKTSGLSGLAGLSDILGGSSSSGGSGALPGNLQATSLAAAPVTQGSTNMNINQLKQLYPQLSNVDPRVLSALTGKTASTPNYYTYGHDQGGATALSMQGQGGAPHPGYPSNAASSAGTSTGFATPSSPNSNFNALASAGLRSLNTGALPGAFKNGGNVHIPQFKTGTTGHFVQGEGDGQSDDIPAMLADGEYVFDADTVAALGNGSSKAGALQLDKMRESIRKHKRSAPHDKIPPKAKSPLEYLKG